MKDSSLYKNFSEGFLVVKENLLKLFVFSLITLIYWIPPFYIGRFLLGINRFLGSFIFLFIVLIDFIVLTGYIKIGFNISNENPITISDLVTNHQKLPDILISFLFYVIIVLFSMIFLVIPGIFVAVRLSFIPFFVLQYGLNPLEALKKSWIVTQSYFFSLLLIYIGLLIINIIGAISVLGLGLTLPFTLIVLIKIYQDLLRRYKSREIKALEQNIN